MCQVRPLDLPKKSKKKKNAAEEERAAAAALASAQAAAAASATVQASSAFPAPSRPSKCLMLYNATLPNSPGGCGGQAPL